MCLVEDSPTIGETREELAGAIQICPSVFPIIYSHSYKCVTSILVCHLRLELSTRLTAHVKELWRNFISILVCADMNRTACTRLGDSKTSVEAISSKPRPFHYNPIQSLVVM